jgi:hypothetical protein
MASNSGDSLASVLMSPLNGGSLPTEFSLHRLTNDQLNTLATPTKSSFRRLTDQALTLALACNILARTTYKTPFLCCRGNVFTEPFPSSGRLFLLIKTLFCCLFTGRCLEMKVVSEPFTSSGCFSDSTVLALSKYALILSCVSDYTQGLDWW